MTASLLKTNNKLDILTFNEIEYSFIIKSNKYWCSIYDTNDIDADFILSDCVYTYLEKKKNNKIKVLNTDIPDENLRLIRLKSFIKIMCRNCLINYFNKKNGKTKPEIINESQLINEETNYNIYKNLTNNKELLTEIIENKFKKKLLYIYESLSEKEQEIYDMLSSENINTGKKFTKSSVIKALKITTKEYEQYIEKLKNILFKVLGVNSSNYKQFLT